MRASCRSSWTSPSFGPHSINLVEAAGQGQLRELQAKLHLTGVDVDREKNYYGRTALMEAAENGHMEAIQLLLHAGPNTADKNGYTALIVAARKGHTEAAQLLLQADADPNAASNNGETSLMEAAVNGRTKVIQLLLCGRAYPDR